MVSPRKSHRFAAPVLLVVALAIPAAGLAAGGNTVHIKAPHTAKLHKNLNYSISGYSSSASNELAVFVNTKTKCSKNANTESDGPFGGTGLEHALPKGHFGGKIYKLTVTSEFKGVQYICVYITSSSHKTLAKASSKYVVTK
jgi:hypothetical protein